MAEGERARRWTIMSRNAELPAWVVYRKSSYLPRLSVDSRDVTTSAPGVTPHPLVAHGQMGTDMQGATGWPGHACVAGSDL
jgi:hypothetical protein